MGQPVVVLIISHHHIMVDNHVRPVAGLSPNSLVVQLEFTLQTTPPTICRKTTVVQHAGMHQEYVCHVFCDCLL